MVSKTDIVKYVSEKKAMINPDAITVLENQEEFKSLIDEVLKEDFFITKDTIEWVVSKQTTKVEPQKTIEIKNKSFDPIAKNTKPRFRVLDEYDISGKSISEGKIQNFIELFRDKFDFLKSLLQSRTSLEAKPISRLERVAKGSNVGVIGMVESKRLSKNGHLCIMLEDSESDCLVLLLKDDPLFLEYSNRIALDDVIGVRGIKGSGKLLIAKELLYPELPLRRQKTSERDLNLCTTSDIHIGSKFFLEKDFLKFLNWIKGNTNSAKEKEEIGKIKYLIIAGDLVDGIGVYPRQDSELEILDIYKQYERFEQYILDIPDYIEIFIGPGNHDAVRRADPQPPVSEEFLPNLYKQKNVHMISSPGWVEIENQKVLTYHGASLHDFYSQISGLSATKPEEAIKEALKRRCLAPSYGVRNPYVPEKKDYMLVRELPDIYIGGDMHHVGYSNYRGTLIVNNGAWQSQTEFQIKLGHVPTPGIVPVINLKTKKISEYYFSKSKEDSSE